MNCLSKFPQDILSKLLTLLSLKDICSLRQTCHELDSSISNDKQLWAYIYRREIVSRGSRLPSYRRSLEQIDSACLESWTSSGIVLDQSYRIGNDTQVFQENGLPCITWLKLVRGRWCIVASSDFSQSRLLVYDGLSELQLKAEFFFPGPLMDGQLDDNTLEINMAFTIGARVPYIDILTLSVNEDGFALKRRSTIADASFTRFINHNFVGFAVLKGDDIFPQLFDWRTGRSWSLNTDGFSTLSVEQRGACWGMTMWKNEIVVVFAKVVQIFDVPVSDMEGSSLNFACELLLELPEAVCEAQFIVYDVGSPDQNKENNLNDITPQYIFVRDRDCEISLLEIYKEISLAGVRSYFIKVRDGIYTYYRSQKSEDIYQPYNMAIGSSGYAVAWCGAHIAPKRKMILPTLRLSKIDTTLVGSFREKGTTPELPVFYGSIPISRKGLPMLHHFPCMDFDDARGILLLGTSIGELRCIHFKGSELLLQRSFFDEIPSTITNSELPHDYIPAHSIPEDLPLYYGWQAAEREKVDLTIHPYKLIVSTIIHDSQSIPSNLIQEMTRRLNLPNFRHLTASGWSNEWSNFVYLEEWIVPTLRWGYRDILYDDSGLSELRHDTHILGDPTPILFTKNNLDVIFLLGERLYLFCYENDVSGSMSSLWKINARIEELSEDILQNLLRNPALVTKVEELGGDSGFEIQIEMIDLYDRAAALVDRVDILRNGESPAEWSSERWKRIQDIRDELLHKGGLEQPYSSLKAIVDKYSIK